MNKKNICLFMAMGFSCALAIGSFANRAALNAVSSVQSPYSLTINKSNLTIHTKNNALSSVDSRFFGESTKICAKYLLYSFYTPNENIKAIRMNTDLGKVTNTCYSDNAIAIFHRQTVDNGTYYLSNGFGTDDYAYSHNKFDGINKITVKHKYADVVNAEQLLNLSLKLSWGFEKEDETEGVSGCTLCTFPDEITSLSDTGNTTVDEEGVLTTTFTYDPATYSLDDVYPSFFKLSNTSTTNSDEFYEMTFEYSCTASSLLN